MDINNKQYPYPVLSVGNDDYKNSNFTVHIEAPKDGANVTLEFRAALENTQLIKLIEEGKAVFAYHLECSQTSFRELVSTKNYIEKRTISNEKLNGLLVISSFIIAKQDISAYVNDAFNDDYQGMQFEIDAGCVLAVGEQNRIIIEKDNQDFDNPPSIFSIVQNDDLAVSWMEINTSLTKKIVIKLPAEDYYRYGSISNNPKVIAALNSLIIIPTLIYVLDEVFNTPAEQRDEYYGDNMWYRALRKAINKKFSINLDEDDINEHALHGNTLVIAQKLIATPLSDALKSIVEGDNSSTEGDE